MFPKNLCTKCESALFEAFIFKQRSAKSHSLLKKILNVFDDDGQHHSSGENDPLVAQRKSQCTQTQPLNEEIEWNQEYKLEVEHMESVEVNALTEAEPAEENDDENWHLVCDSNDTEDDDADEDRDISIEEETDDFQASENITQDDKMPMEAMKISVIDVIECEYCCQAVTKRQQLSHAKQHSKILPYILNSVDFFRCNRCQMIFLSFDNFAEHLNDTNGCYEALQSKDDLCTDYQYLNNDLPIRLLSASKNMEENTFSCGQCALDFDDLALYRSHIDDNHFSDFECNPDRADSSHSCGNCRNSFKTLRETAHHIYFHQTEFRCLQAECTHVFNSFADLYSHFMNEHPESTHECPYCSYIASDKNDLKMHKSKMCIARNLQCAHCGKYEVKLRRNTRSKLILTTFYNR